MFTFLMQGKMYISAPFWHQKFHFHREPTLIFVNCKWKQMREKNLLVLFLNLLRSKVKWKLLYDAKTMLLFVSALCRKFYNA